MKKTKMTDNFEITIRYAKVKVHISDDVYSEEDIKKIEYAVKVFSREIVIDRTFVAYKKSKYDKHFLTEKGWNELCQLLKKTKYGKKTTTEQHEMLQSAYYLMILSYIYMCLKDYGYDSDGIYLEIPQKSYYMVEIAKDTYDEYSRYPGKWQTWKA